MGLRRCNGGEHGLSTREKEEREVRHMTLERMYELGVIAYYI